MHRFLMNAFWLKDISFLSYGASLLAKSLKMTFAKE
jgi:hypothetical protein